MRNVANVGYRFHTDPIFSKLGLLKFPDLFKTNVCNFIHKYHFNKLPGSFNGMFQLQRNTGQILIRNGHENYVVSIPKSKSISQFPRPKFIPIWNGLTETVKATQSHTVFKKQIKEHFIESYPINCDFANCQYCD